MYEPSYKESIYPFSFIDSRVSDTENIDGSICVDCTGCPISKFPLCFGCFLGFQSLYRGDIDSKTHLSFLLMSKIDQVKAQNMRQTGY